MGRSAGMGAVGHQMRLATGPDDTINPRDPPITGGRPVRGHQWPAPPSLGYDPTGIRHGPLAQPAEHRTFNPGVVGSIPTRPTKLDKIKNFHHYLYFGTVISPQIRHRSFSRDQRWVYSVAIKRSKSPRRLSEGF